MGGDRNGCGGDRTGEIGLDRIGDVGKDWRGGDTTGDVRKGLAGWEQDWWGGDRTGGGRDRTGVAVTELERGGDRNGGIGDKTGLERAHEWRQRVQKPERGENRTSEDRTVRAWKGLKGRNFKGVGT
jgi:hypothetical protein